MIAILATISLATFIFSGGSYYFHHIPTHDEQVFAWFQHAISTNSPRFLYFLIQFQAIFRTSFGPEAVQNLQNLVSSSVEYQTYFIFIKKMCEYQFLGSYNLMGDSVFEAVSRVQLTAQMADWMNHLSQYMNKDNFNCFVDVYRDFSERKFDLNHLPMPAMQGNPPALPALPQNQPENPPVNNAKHYLVGMGLGLLGCAVTAALYVFSGGHVSKMTS